ncbi:helicase [Paenibacillus xylanexedens]|uniref:helicase n=1 Tax=Paenibacillus xylanexedens TaxID=528191 RepID=UPI0011A5BA21|nr:helicase [Paenibacillus xylanexedens]
MLIEDEKVYPDCAVKIRIVDVGGLTKPQLIQKLDQHSILLNKYGEQLLYDDRFIVSSTKQSLQTVELTVRQLGFSDGASTFQLFRRANDLGLECCPVELGPYLRMQYLDQPEICSTNISEGNKAPSGSITIASAALTEDIDFPKGFYLRRINDKLWLRGYLADDLHIWSPHDRFIFCRAQLSIV